MTSWTSGRAPTAHEVDIHTSVRDALSLMLTVGGRPLTVVDGERPVGTVTLELVERVLADARPDPEAAT